jgi:hypothetical protein
MRNDHQSAKVRPRGVGAASRWMGASELMASVFVVAALLGSGCSIEQPISGPVALPSEWKTFAPPEPLRVAGKYEQKACLYVDGAPTDVDFERGAVLVDGHWHVLNGEAVDNEQTTYGLEVGQLGGNTLCLTRAADTPPGPDFPADRTIVRLRLRSDPPLQVGKIWWLSYDPK